MRLLIATLVLASAVSVEASDKHITTTGANLKNGTDWDNACDGFTGSCAVTAFTRGDVVYVAEGDYRPDGVISLNEAASSTTYIKIFKAIAANHGSSTGWVDSMGDEVAIFDRLVFNNPYWEWDGQVGEGCTPKCKTYTPYGFKVHVQLCTAANNGVTITAVNLGLGNAGMRLRHTEVEHCGEDAKFDGTIALADCSAVPAADGCGLSADGIRSANAGAFTSDLEITDVWVHGLTRNGLTINDIDDVTLDRVIVSDLHSFDTSIHGQGIQFGRPPMDNVTVRYSKFIDIKGTAAISWLGSSGPDGELFTNHRVFGSEFYTTVDTSAGLSGRYWTSPGILYGRTAEGALSIGQVGFRIYNNTFNNLVKAEPFFEGELNSDIEIKNNLYCNSQFSGNPPTTAITSTHNAFCDSNSGAFLPAGEPGQQTIVGDPFTDAASFDFTLSAATAAGVILASPYDTDSTGATRGADGTWDRGAFELDGLGGAPTSGSGRSRVRRPYFVLNHSPSHDDEGHRAEQHERGRRARVWDGELYVRLNIQTLKVARLESSGIDRTQNKLRAFFWMQRIPQEDKDVFVERSKRWCWLPFDEVPCQATKKTWPLKRLSADQRVCPDGHRREPISQIGGIVDQCAEELVTDLKAWQIDFGVVGKRDYAGVIERDRGRFGARGQDEKNRQTEQNVTRVREQHDEPGVQRHRGLLQAKPNHSRKSEGSEIWR